MLTKDQVQANMLKFYQTNPFCMFLVTMGGGKTKGALDCAKSTHDRITSTSFASHSRGLIVTHSVTSRDTTWPEEIEQYHKWMIPEINQGFIRIVHRKDVLNIVAETFDWVIWDECHLMKEQDRAFFMANNILSLMLLTGTEPSDQDLKNYLRTMARHKVFQLTVDEGIENELINDYRVKIIKIKPTDEEWDDYLNIGKRIHKIRFVENYAALRSVQGMRMHFIYQMESKVKVARQIGELLDKERLIYFCASKEICSTLSPYIYHSGTDETDLDKFKNGEIDRLASCRQLRTGANIRDFKHIVAQQVNSKGEDFFQLLARLFRLRIGEIGTFHVLVAENTQDYVWVTSALRPVNPAKCKWYSLEETPLYEIVHDVF